MMPPPPPPPKRNSPPPPPSATATFPPPEPAVPPISPDLKRIDLECAVWVHGGYPQVSWPDAVRELYRKCHDTIYGNICAAAILELDKTLPADCDLVRDKIASLERRFSRKLLTGDPQNGD